MMTERIRRKYNTLTPAEAKKLNLAAKRVPIRTASVLHKPRAPDGFSLARSQVLSASGASGRSSSVTPTKFDHLPANTPEPTRSASKLSLSSSTYKVFQSPLTNIKRLLRGIHRPFSQASDSAGGSQKQPNKASKQQPCDESLSDFSFSDSISQISLNKSQSPTILPPPASELKSMCYIESGVNYSNYDEFTRARNQRLSRGNLRNFSNQNSVPYTLNSNNQQQQHEQHSPLNLNKSDDSDDCSWQMTSLPVYYERKMTTLFEEKHPPYNGTVINRSPAQIVTTNLDHDSTAPDTDEIYQTIKPPRRFEDPKNQHLTDGAQVNCDRPPSVNSSKSQPQSLMFINDQSTLGFYRQHHATPFRFSFAQPLNDAEQQAHGTNLGLPPRMPTDYQQTPATATSTHSENQRQDNSSSGNSSNCSSQVNGFNYCDRRNSLESSGSTSATHTIDKLSYSIEDSGGYGNLNDVLDNDPDTTILSEASTIRGESGATFYANKCAELERTVATLKNKLIAKEKDLTELQLVQLNNDYTIERLKKQVNKLERENVQLRTMVASNGNSANFGANTISRMQI